MALSPILLQYFFFFFNDTATTEIYTLSLHDALPIFGTEAWILVQRRGYTRLEVHELREQPIGQRDRKSTRLNSSHGYISYAVFCLKKKKTRTEKYKLTVVAIICLNNLTQSFTVSISL